MVALNDPNAECCTACGNDMSRGIYFFQRARVCKQCYAELTEAQRYEELGRAWAERHDDPLNAARGIAVGLALTAAVVFLSWAVQ